MEADRRALENFIVGNAELEKLEAMLDRFNIFEAIGMVRRETKHSKFLSFLLDPKQPHGLGDAFLKRFLQSAVAGTDSEKVSPMELNLDGTTVWREKDYIDIFLLDDENRLAVIVENKIGSVEHSGQLGRYYDLVREQHPQHRILAIYLTPNGDKPSHLEYLPLGYGTVCRILDEVRQSKADVMQPDAAVLVSHYTDMMRRNIVGDSEVTRLAQEIYRKHSRAIDLIYRNQHKSQEDIRDQIREFCNVLIQEQDNFELRQDGKNKIHFDIGYWIVPGSATFYFEFWNFPKNLELKLFVGRGDTEVRERLFEMIRRDAKTFSSHGSLGGKWSLAYSYRLLEEPFYSEIIKDTEREAEIRRNWNDFLENDLPHIDAALRREEWIWEDASETAPE